MINAHAGADKSRVGLTPAARIKLTDCRRRQRWSGKETLKSKKKPERKKGAAVRVQRMVRQITDELLTVNFGDASAQKGHRLAIMQGEYPSEKNLGGRCRRAIEWVLTRHLSNRRFSL